MAGAAALQSRRDSLDRPLGGSAKPPFDLALVDVSLGGGGEEDESRSVRLLHFTNPATMFGRSPGMEKHGAAMRPCYVVPQG
eukprot:1234762-Pyramimonas_sp.AAC.1